MDCITNYIPDYDEPQELTPDLEREAEIGQLSDNVHMANRKGVAIRRLLNNELTDFTGIPTDRVLLEWMMKGFFEEANRAEVRIAELEDEQAAHREALRRELETLQKTTDLHYQGLDELAKRRAVIMAEMLHTYDDLEVPNVA
jgi:hypothetical protein